MAVPLGQQSLTATRTTPVLDRSQSIVRLPEISRHRTKVRGNSLEELVQRRLRTVELAVRDAVHGGGILNSEAFANPEALDCFQTWPELQSWTWSNCAPR